MPLLDFVDGLLNQITMYRLVLYFLVALIAIAALFGAFGILPYSPLAIIFSAAVLLLVSLVTNQLFAMAFGAQPNVESVYITALILALIITPVMPFGGSGAGGAGGAGTSAAGTAGLAGISFLVWAAVWAMACKYMLAARKKHIFNPAAFAVALTAITIGQSASWWIGGNLPMLGFVVVGGLLVTRKIQRFDLVLSFLAAALATIVFTNTASDPFSTIQKAILHAPIFFFVFIMLTEPLTTPPTRALRIAYGALVGFLFAPAIHIGSIYSTPELALLVGNIFSYLVSPKEKYVLKLVRTEPIGTDIGNFVFATETKTDRQPRFWPGQYMEWTLAHKTSDSRGNRRYFTLASSPTEREVHLGVKFYTPSSSFKKRLLAMVPGDKIVAGQLAGDFTLPRDKRKKLVFVAGGIGITPFRSMVKYLVDSGDRRDAVLLYSNRLVSEIAYRDVFDEAATQIGLRTIYTITAPNEPLPDVTAAPGANGMPGAPGAQYRRGRIDAKLIEQTIPDYRERMFYISGTRGMVNTFHDTLKTLGVPARHVKTDFFPGFV